MCPFCFYFCIQIMLKTDMEDKKSLAGAWVEAARPRTCLLYTSRNYKKKKILLFASICVPLSDKMND